MVLKLRLLQLSSRLTRNVFGPVLINGVLLKLSFCRSNVGETLRVSIASDMLLRLRSRRLTR